MQWLDSTTRSTSSSPQMLISFSENIFWFRTLMIRSSFSSAPIQPPKIDLNLIAVVLCCFVLEWVFEGHNEGRGRGGPPPDINIIIPLNRDLLQDEPQLWLDADMSCVCFSSPQLSDPTIRMNTRKMEWVVNKLRSNPKKHNVKLYKN